MENICDICGFKNPDGACFCGGCGVDLREKDESPETIIPKKKTRSPKKKKEDEKKNNQQDNVIKWCQIHSAMNFHEMTFTSFLILYHQLVMGEKKLGFCNCSICNLGYREFHTKYINMTENKKLKPNSREIVSKFHDTDISKICYDLSEYWKKDISKPEESKINESYETTKSNDKISIEINSNVLESLILKVLSSESGQNLIKKSIK